MSIVLVTEATTEPVTLEEALEQLRLGEDSGEEEIVQRYIPYARKFVEKYTGRSLAPQTWRQRLEFFPEIIRLTKGPVTSITSIQYFDEDNASQTITVPDDIITDFDSVPARVTPLVDEDWPDTEVRVDAVNTTYEAGFTAALIPGNLKDLILLIISHLYDHRGDGKMDIPEAFKTMAESERQDLVL